MSNKVFSEKLYFCEDNGAHLKVYAYGAEATLAYCGKEVGIAATNTQSLASNLEELRDLFQAAIDDLAIPALDESAAC